jgi:hypothetical protein
LYNDKYKADKKINSGERGHAQIDTAMSTFRQRGGVTQEMQVDWLDDPNLASTPAPNPAPAPTPAPTTQTQTSTQTSRQFPTTLPLTLPLGLPKAWLGRG